MLKRTQISPLLKEVMEVSKFLTLYLIESHPPSGFTFIDPLENQVTVTLGNHPKCTCLPGNKDHCMHTFYVLMKIYKLKPDDPLIYQQEYTQSQLIDIFSGQRAKNFKSKSSGAKPKIKQIEKQQKNQSQIKIQTPQNSQVQPQRLFSQQKTKQQMPYISQKKVQQSVSKQIKTIKPVSLLQQQKQAPNFKKKAILIQTQVYQGPVNIEPETVCSICYEPLQNQTPLLKCTSICFNFFHTKCLRFWIDYQIKQQIDPSCPMCRGKFIFNIQEKLKKAQQLFVKCYQSFQVNCCECGSQIKMKLFRCLMCKQANVCEPCYLGWKHPTHDRYLMKKSKKAQWSLPLARTQMSMAKLDMSLKYVKQFKDQNQMKHLFGANYQRFLQANLKKQTILGYIIDSFVSVQKEVKKTYKKIDYEEKDIKCILCRKGKITQMRRLPCKHFIDEKCLTFLLLNGQRTCPADKCFLLPCFESIKLKIKKKQ